MSAAQEESEQVRSEQAAAGAVAGFDPADITRIFVTHLHGDHCFGLPGTLTLIDEARRVAESELGGGVESVRHPRRDDVVEVCGPPGLARIVLGGLGPAVAANRAGGGGDDDFGALGGFATRVRITEFVTCAEDARPDAPAGLSGLLTVRRLAPDAESLGTGSGEGEASQGDATMNMASSPRGAGDAPSWAGDVPAAAVERGEALAPSPSPRTEPSPSPPPPVPAPAPLRTPGRSARRIPFRRAGPAGGAGLAPPPGGAPPPWGASAGGVGAPPPGPGAPPAPRPPPPPAALGPRGDGLSDSSSSRGIQQPSWLLDPLSGTDPDSFSDGPDEIAADDDDDNGFERATSGDGRGRGGAAQGRGGGRGSGGRGWGRGRAGGYSGYRPPRGAPYRLEEACAAIPRRLQDERRRYRGLDRLTWTMLCEGGFVVRAARLLHRLPCWGYVVDEPPYEFGAAEGDDEASFAATEDASPRGRRVVVLGDTHCSEHLAAMAREADVLVHEATFADGQEGKAARAGHSTARMAGRFAASVNARSLVLTHFSPRFAADIGDGGARGHGEAHDVGLLRRQAEDECREGGTRVFAASDFFTFKVRARSGRRL